MVTLNPRELAQVLWQTNQPNAKPLDEQDESMQKVYLKAADAVIDWLAQKAVESTPAYPADLLDRLAEELAYKYLNPMGFVDGIRETFDLYSQEVGRENVPAVVDQAIARVS